MSDRIEQVLDGELAREALGVAELRELERLEGELQPLVRELESLATPDLSTAVLWRIRQLEPVPGWVPASLVGVWQALAHGFRWLWQPRAIALRPALVLGALAVIVAVPFAARTAGLFGGGSDQVEPLLVQFRLGAEDARQVALVGDFTEWQGQYALEQIAPGVWSIVIPLEPGVYDYQFVIDGERWTVDPLAPAVADGFGGTNSRIAVLAADGDRNL